MGVAVLAGVGNTHAISQQISLPYRLTGQIVSTSCEFSRQSWPRGWQQWHVTRKSIWLDITGRVLTMLPLRNRKEGKVTRISEGMTEWRCGAPVGYGLSEYLDQVV